MQPIPGLSAGLLQGSPLAAPILAGSPLASSGPLAANGAGAAPQTSFKDLLLESIGHVNDMQRSADQAVEQLLTGGDANAAEVLTALQKADMSFRLMLQIRNKLTEAYQQVQAIQI